MIKYLFVQLLILAAIPACAQQPSASITVPLIPAPLQATVQTQGFTLNNGAVITVPDKPQIVENAHWVAGLIREHAGISLEVSSHLDKSAAIRMGLPGEETMRELFRAAGLEPVQLDEAYHLVIGPNGVSLDAGSEAGLFRGMATLWQLLTAGSEGSGKLPGLEILDAPEFAWRGLMLDSARHMQSVEFIKNYIDWMSLHKLNVFHWHLTDDQAWRLEIKAYPKLASVGGFRVPAGAAPAADIDEETGKPRLYGGYYSHKEVREIVAHAASRHITATVLAP